MTLDQARNHFGNYARLAKALGISRGAITQWSGRIPEARQIDLHRLTRGQLRADGWILMKYRQLLRAA